MSKQTPGNSRGEKKTRFFFVVFQLLLLLLMNSKRRRHTLLLLHPPPLLSITREGKSYEPLPFIDYLGWLYVPTKRKATRDIRKKIRLLSTGAHQIPVMGVTWSPLYSHHWRRIKPATRLKRNQPLATIFYCFHTFLLIFNLEWR